MSFVKYFYKCHQMPLIRYLAVGGLVAGIYLVTLFALVQYAGMHTPVAILFAYLSTAVLRFLLHRFWVFNAEYTMKYSQAIKYTVMMACSYFLNAGIAEILEHKFFWDKAYIAVSSAIVVTTFAYITSSKWVFK